MKDAYMVVNALANQLGISWTPDNGLGITKDSLDVKDVWKEYMAV
jgi:hypothetical protein